MTLLISGSAKSWGQDNPLRLADGSDTISQDVETDAQRQERQLAEQIASICSQHVGPWLQWLTLASQKSDSALNANEPPESANLIIEIPEATLQAIQKQEETDADGGDESKDPADVFIDSEKKLLPKEPAPLMVLGEDEPESSVMETEEPEAPSSNVPRESPTRHVRSPRQFKDAEEPESPPRTLSESMKSKAEAARIQRSLKSTDLKPLDVKPTEPKTPEPPSAELKSADEDMRAYLAQEEPTAESVRNSTSDQLQGVDADRAAKPDAPSVLGDGVTRAPSKPTAKPDRLRADIPPAMQQRLQRVQACIEHYSKNPETTTSRSPWAVMHALLPYGADYELIGPKGRVNAIGWMCHNGLCRTQRIFTPRGDSFVPNVGGGVQGHQGQFLAILAQSQVPLDYPIQIGSKKFTVEDLVRYEMATCKEKSELTFKLIGLSYYVDADKQWRSNDGKVWNLEKLVREELAQPVIGSACGGTHRLMGLSFSLRQRELQGQPINGQFARAAQFVNEYVRYTWQLQNPDGSFSTNWYQGRANEPNDERKVQTSGHMLEWLMFTVSDEELRSPRVEKAVDFLLSKIHDRRDLKWPIGPRGHATRALALYYLRTETLLEPRSGILSDSTTQARIAMPEAGKNTFSTPPPTASLRSQATTQQTPPMRASQPANPPANPPASQPSNRSTNRPNRRVRG